MISRGFNAQCRVYHDSKAKDCDMQAEERPSSRLMQKGPASLSNAELLSIILKTGSAAENAINLSQGVLSQYDLKQLSAIDVPQLMKIHGIESAKAAQRAACFDLAYEFIQQAYNNGLSYCD